MSKCAFFSFLGFFFISTNLFTQSILPDFGINSTEEIGMTQCSFDKDAEAVILLDEANSSYDDNYQLITERRIRIKILNQRGVDRGSIKIFFYSKGNFEFIRKVEAVAYTPDSAITEVKVSKKSIYTVKENDRFSTVRFALPNVKIGSIIEYKYTSVMKHYGGLDKWLFQSDIPTLKSCYTLQVLPNSEFSYLVTKKKNFDIIIKSPQGNGIVYFEMNNIPGLRFEPYMDAVKDYLQKVEFKFSGYVNIFGDKKEVGETWKSIALDLLTDESLGGVLKKKLSVPDDLITKVVGESSNINKATIIYNYVKKYFTWNGYDSKYAPEGLKKVWESRTGTAGELNLILIHLLQSFELEASPLLVAERDFGKTDPAHIYIDRFNKTVAYLTIDSKNYILDATQKYCPATLIPYPLLNTFALLINKKTDKLLEISSKEEVYKNVIKIDASITKEGLLNGKCEINSSDYAEVSNITMIKDNKDNFITKEYESPYQGLKIDSFSYNYSEFDRTPLVQNFNFLNQLDNTGGFVLFNYNLFTGLSKNPFTADERFTNINFGYPYQVNIEQSVELPVNSKIEGILKDKTLEVGNKDIFLTREIKINGNKILIKIIFRQNITLITADSYPTLKTFYQSMISILNEPLVIKLGI